MLVSKRHEPGILELRLNRPQRLNALTLALAEHLLEAVQHANDDAGVRVLLLGAEGRAFCAGKDRDDPASARFVELLQQLALALMRSPKPVVAAVQGWAVGAGLELLLNCDIVVASEDARFMLPEVNAGLFGTGGVMALLPRKIGLARAKGALLLGQEFTATQAQQWGLVWSVVGPDDLHAGALAIARQLAGSDAAVLAQIKASLHRESMGDLAEALGREARDHWRLSQGPAASRPGGP